MPTKAQVEIPVRQEEHRSIFQSMKQIIGSVADAATMTSQAIGKTAGMLDSLAETGLVMADSNRKIVTYETLGKEHRKMIELKTQYPDIQL